MLIDYVENAMDLYEKTDALLICDKDGYIEYTKWAERKYFDCKEVVGKHILEVYPTLTEETSTVMRCLRTGAARVDDEQDIPNYKGDRIHIVSATFPIKVHGEIIGALCASVFCGNEESVAREQHKNHKHRLYRLNDIITCSKSMKELKARIKAVASNSSSVLIYGETGTGKELVAESIHTEGHRRNKPFVSQNCAAIPTSLLEGIFFGTEKGSYTGAESRKGLFELADGGTLFLDELNSMDTGMQAKLLKVIEEKKVRRIGGDRDIEVDIRIVSAMNENPADTLRKGRLREDLYYRISVVQIRIPPLRERRQDIMLLTDYFIAEYNADMGRHVAGLSELARNVFETNYWYGNVRELRNVVESAFSTVTHDLITIKDLPEFFLARNEEIFNENIEIRGDNFSLSAAVSDYEKKIISAVLKDSKNMAEAARRLKVSRQNLKYKLDKYGIDY